MFIGGAKVISLNEKQRGFPVGLRVMTSDRYDDCLLEVEPSLEVARFRGGDGMSVRRVEVWGCGGVEAAESQRRVKVWEKQEILRRRKVREERNHHTILTYIIINTLVYCTRAYWWLDPFPLFPI